MIKFDKQHWKLNKLIKDEADYVNVVSCLRENVEYLKDVFLQYSTDSNYPFVGVLVIQPFCE